MSYSIRSTQDGVAQGGRAGVSWIVLVDEGVAKSGSSVRLYDKTSAPVSGDVPVIELVLDRTTDGETKTLIFPHPLKFESAGIYVDISGDSPVVYIGVR
jgi:hypothetical protein